MYYDIFKELNKLDESQENKLEEVFETHSNLNQKLFDENILREDVRKQLIKIADIFVDSIKEDQIPIKVYDYWLVGSNAAYNYNDESDIDVHIIVDINSLGLNPYLISLLYNYIKSSFNDKYDIKVKGHEVELYLEDIETTAITNGIYSLKQDKWIKEPTPPVEITSYNVEETELWDDWYERYQNIDEREAEQFLDDLYMMRKMSLANDGEFGTGNLVFKEFRNRGYLDDLKNKKYKYRSGELTLEKLEEDYLCEKHWIEAEASDGSIKQRFAFYATDKSPTADLNTLLPIINGTQTGTYKQSLDKDILANLKTLYKNNPASFTLNMIRSLGTSAGTIPRITLMDRDLRKEVSDIANNSLSLTPEQKKHLADYSCDKIYVHHINKHEDDNTPSNLLLIGYPSNDLGYAHAVHQIAHNGKAAPPVQLSTGTKTLPYLDCSTGHTGVVEFNIT